MPRGLTALLFGVALLLPMALFWPGLDGPLFFDDVPSLGKLSGEDGRLDSWEEAYRLIFPDHGGTGRSLAYLSLLIDDNGYPVVARGFKRTNLLLHMLNGVLVFAFVRALLRGRGGLDQQADTAALIAMALWIIHPIHLSPTMMVIQRMTLLGAGFSLLALLAYLHGRRLAQSRPLRGLAWLTIGFGTFLLLGLASKEIALITTLYVLVIEFTLYQSGAPKRPYWWPKWALVFLGLPLLATAVYIAVIWSPTIVESYNARPFSVGERLLTQPRILVDYLDAILFPSLRDFGPYFDDYTPSRNLLTPPTTLAALIFLAFLLALAVLKRRAWPWFAFPVLWFFAGHLLESTVLPLELYFEHRNYLPMLGFFIGVGWLVIAVSGKYRAAFGAAVIAYGALSASIAFATAGVWGSHERIAIIWSAEHPRSPRAQLAAMHYLAAHGSREQQIEQLRTAVSHLPEAIGFRLSLLVAERCWEPPLADSDSWPDVVRSAPTVPLDAVALETLHWLARGKNSDTCRISPNELQKLLDLFIGNPRFTQRPEVRGNLWIAKADLYRRTGDLDGAIRAQDKAYEAWPAIQIPLQQAYDLATAGLFADARDYIEKARKAPNQSLYDRLTRDEQIEVIQRAIGVFEEQWQRSPPPAPAN